MQYAAQDVVNITNSFAVPFEEDDKDPKIWFLDHNYLENMFAMFKKVNGEFVRFLLRSLLLWIFDLAAFRV